MIKRSGCATLSLLCVRREYFENNESVETGGQILG